ncbi:LacI family DNA-binding transcriptional regulator [Branchiibius cervicis]|uniref:LacI family DNA-binding transcriptional regulator n=1 Tax=Branchiibius cervicis TaxID=908252 RepID=A0ABW2ASQ3_9MICO
MPPDAHPLTLADIARLAGVGLATASRALNGAPGVAPATRAKVLAVAEENAFVVSPDASRLAGGAQRRVAIVVPHISRWFFGTIVEAMLTVFQNADLDVLLYHVGSEAERHDFFEKLPARRKVDAVVVVAFPVDEQERQRIELLGVQIVAAGGQHAVYPHVCIDDVNAGRTAVNHLIGLGHRRIAMIEAVDPEQPVQPRGRSMAFYDTMAEADIPVEQDLVVSTPWGPEQGAEAMATLLSLPNPPTAVYAHSDEVAFGALRTIRRSGLFVPEDISIVSIDDHPMAALTDLTTVHQPVREQGIAAARNVLTLLNGDRPDQATTLPTQLIVRHSTAPPRAATAKTGPARR